MIDKNTENQIISAVSGYFDKWIFQAIEDLLKSKGVSLGFVLMTCAIDYLVSFNIGGKNTTGYDYKLFLKEFPWFIKKYCPDDIWHSLRCELVHQFSIKDGKFLLKHDCPDIHLKQSLDNRIFLNYQDFFEDIKRIKKEYFSQLAHNHSKRLLFIKKFDKRGFLMPVTVPLKK